MCGNIYTEKRSLARHVRSAHDGDRFACECSSKFTRNANVLHHKMRCQGLGKTINWNVL